MRVRGVDKHKEKNAGTRGHAHRIAQISIIASSPMNTIGDKGQRVEWLGQGADEKSGQEKRVGARRD